VTSGEWSARKSYTTQLPSAKSVHPNNGMAMVLDSELPSATDTSNTSPEDAYFTTNPAPPTLRRDTTIAHHFIDFHVAAGHRLVLVTSGGTTVPLENQTVRFIDNFSAGTRGATSAEYFIRAGYAVIFLHRKFSLLPFSRHYSHSTNCFLDFMTEGSDGNVLVDNKYKDDMMKVLKEYHAAKAQNKLLLLSFTTITEYLWMLREIAVLMRPLGHNGMFYLAAAVSDFFVPQERMAEHKIQSSDVNTKQPGKLIVDLDPVPKFLKRLVDGWAPDCMIVSFKLETDPALLLKKAHQSLDRYSHHLVIGNLLSTRKWEVVFVSKDGGDVWIRIPRHRRTKSLSGSEHQVGLAALADFDMQKVHELPVEEEIDGPGSLEIESVIIPEVARLHTLAIEKAAQNAAK
jgi:phosphopantothenate-cysteine ligase